MDIVLTPEDDKRIDEIYSLMYCKQENNNMKFPEFLGFVLDRELLSAKYGLKFYFEQYYHYLALPEIMPPVPKGKQPLAPEVGKFSRQKFIRFIGGLGKLMYPSQKKSLDMILKDVYQDNKRRNEIRVLVQDELNKRMLSEQAISVLLDYENDLQALFTMYQSENYYQIDQMLSWNEVKLINLRMPTSSLIHFLFDAQIVPVHYSPDNVEDICMKVLPATSPKELQFYQGNNISQLCDQIVGQKYKYKPIEGDPKMAFFEFSFLIARCGLEILTRDGSFDTKKDITAPMRQFMTQIGLTVNGAYQPKDTFKHLQLIHKCYTYKPPVAELSKQSTIASTSDLRQLNYEFLGRKYDPLDYRELMRFFTADLPPLPQIKKSQDLCRNFRDNVKEGERKKELAKQQEEDKKNKNKQKPGDKKDAETYKYQWEAANQPKQISSYQYFIDYVRETEKTNKMRDMNQLDTLSSITPAPVLLPECVYPLHAPKEVQQLVESAIICFTQQNYHLASGNLRDAQERWQQIRQNELSDQEMVFFEYFGGQIFEIAGQDEAALNKFMKVKMHADKLHKEHPDRALQYIHLISRPYCGFGSVFYHTYEYELAARAFIKAREIRESFLGDENVENGLIFNNLGCALHQLGEYFSAETCYLFAVTLFEMHFGPIHEITLTAKRNLSKLHATNKHN